MRANTPAYLPWMSINDVLYIEIKSRHYRTFFLFDNAPVMGLLSVVQHFSTMKETNFLLNIHQISGQWGVRNKQASLFILGVKDLKNIKTLTS